MNKKLLAILVSMSFALATSVANAASFNIGVTGAIATVDATGTETTNAGDNGTANSNSKTVDNENVAIGSIFAEYESDFYGITIGLEHIPGSADVSDATHSRQDTESSKTGDATINTDKRTFKAAAEVENFNLVYAEIPVYQSFFVGAGLSEIDVNTQETPSGNGGSYGNKTIDGTMYIDGGNVIFATEENLNTLIDFRFKQHFKAERGQDGMGKKKTGKSGKDLILKVPIGTQIFEEDNNTLIEDLKNPGQKIVIAKGGRKGLGNVRFKSSTNRAPRKKTEGTDGESLWIWLQLKVIADVGIIGMPNAGKSSLLSALTKARPKIANYPFTTLNPNLGVASYLDKEITLADIPGLIEGAHEGMGLGGKFLRHIERCKNLVHLIDINSENVLEDYLNVRNELSKYSKSLMKKKEIIIFNKIDIVQTDEAKKKIDYFKKKVKKKFFKISVIQKKGLNNIKEILVNNVHKQI